MKMAVNWLTLSWCVLMLLTPRLVTSCCENVRCKPLDCDADRAIVPADPASCNCCDQCSLKQGESCVPGTEQDLCESGLSCFAVDETGDRGKCDSGVPNVPEEYDENTEVEVDSETCSVEDCDRILRCPTDSRLVLDQPTGDIVQQIDNSTIDSPAVSQSDPLDCCKRRFAPKCICDYRQCPTAADVAVRHCLKNPEVTLHVTESCCAQFARCARSTTSTLRGKVTDLPKSSAAKTNDACSSWLNVSHHVVSLHSFNSSSIELCGGSTRLPACPRDLYELSFRSSADSASVSRTSTTASTSPRCCAELKCLSQPEIVCEAARCPQELHFRSALLTNLEACTCVKMKPVGSRQPARLAVCPQRLCAAQPAKCYEHTHTLDASGCPICVSTEISCLTDTPMVEHSTTGVVCEDSRTGRHMPGDRWRSDSCGNCYCAQDGFARCESYDCFQSSNREWVNVNITLVLACAALAISSIVLIYIVVRKVRSRKWKSRHPTTSCQLVKAGVHGGANNEYSELSWQLFNIPHTQMPAYRMMDRHRRAVGSTVWQRPTDLLPEQYVYVALNGNPDAFQADSMVTTTTTTTNTNTTDSNTDVNKSTVV